MTKLVKYIANKINNLTSKGATIEDAEEAVMYNKDLTLTTEGRAIEVVYNKASYIDAVNEPEPAGSTGYEKYDFWDEEF